MKDHLHLMEPEDLVVIEGGGNRLEHTGGRKTVRVIEEIITLVKGKVNRRPLVMGIPMRQGKEHKIFWEGEKVGK